MALINNCSNIIALSFLLLLSPLTAFACEVEKQAVVVHYSSSCPIKVTSSRTTRPVFIQFKFSGKDPGSIEQELEGVWRHLNAAVATQKVSKGYRLLLGPIQAKEVAHFTQGLKSLGYNSTLLRTVPQSRAVMTSSPSSSVPLSPVAPSVGLENTYVKVLGEIGEHRLLAMMDSESRLIKTTFPAALASCAEIGKKVTIATQDEYVALLSSNEALLIFGDDITTPFWMTEKWVVARLEDKVQRRRSAAGVYYGVVCSVAP